MLDDRKRNYQEEYLSWLKYSQKETDDQVDTDLEEIVPEEYKVKRHTGRVKSEQNHKGGMILKKLGERKRNKVLKCFFSFPHADTQDVSYNVFR